MLDRYNIGKEYYKNKKYQKAYKVFFELANMGDVNAQVSLATMLYNGIGVNVDTERAYYWYKIAAEQNNAEALYYCSMHYLEDIGKVDIGKKYLERSVELNYAFAITTYAYYYEHGDHSYKKNKNKAIALYKKSCLLEDPEACLNLYSLMCEQNMKKEFREYIKRDIGYLKYLKIILKDNWKNCFKLYEGKRREGSYDENGNRIADQ